MRTFGIPFPLLDKAGDPTGGSGGGEEKPALTDEQKKEIGGLIAGALKSEGKRMISASVGEAVKTALGELKLGEQIAAEVAKLKPETPEPKPSEGKPDPKIASLEAKLAEVTGKLETEAKARAEAETKARDEKAFASLKSALAPLVRPEALDIAASHLFLSKKSVSFDDDGNPLLTVRKAAFGGGEEDVPMPLGDGVQHWIKSQEGKFFAPPPTGPGHDPRGNAAPRRVNTGSDGMPRYDQPATTDAEKIRRAEERADALRQKYPNL